MESQIGTIPGVKKIRSVSKEGLSLISIDFSWGTDMDYTTLNLREKLDNALFLLPAETERPAIIKMDPADSPIMSLAIFSNLHNSPQGEETLNIQKDSAAKQKFHDIKAEFIDHNSSIYDIQRIINLRQSVKLLVKRRLEQIEGVAQAVITGGLEQEIRITVDPSKLFLYGISYDDISNSLKKANINLPSGNIMKGVFKYSLRTFSEFSSLKDIINTVIKYNEDGSSVLLSDLGTVVNNFKEREGLTRLNGKETIGLLIYKQANTNTVSISRKVQKVISHIMEEYPELDIQVTSDNSGFIEQAIVNVKQEVFYGGILAVIVLFFFLGSIRYIAAIVITIPASIFITILLMSLLGINFNIISLGGLAVGIGMLLDNSIIVIENIGRYQEKGASLIQSVINGISEVSMPVVASTLTTIAVFFSPYFC